jgi:hypothetical protein
MISNWTQARLLHFVLALVMTAAPAFAQESSAPVLTLDDAIQQAVTNNSALKTASLETLRAADDLAANRTRRFANTQIIGLGGQLLTKPSVTFQQGSLGVYPATGPIPAASETGLMTWRSLNSQPQLRQKPSTKWSSFSSNIR